MILAVFFAQTTVFQSIKVSRCGSKSFIGTDNHIRLSAWSYRTGGGFSGLLLDCLYGSVIGLYAFIFMTIGFVVGFCKKIYFTDSLILPVDLIASSDFVYCFYYYITEFLMRGRLHLGFYFIHKFLPEILYTTLAGVLLFELAAHLEKPKERKRKEI